MAVPLSTPRSTVQLRVLLDKAANLGRASDFPFSPETEAEFGV